MSMTPRQIRAYLLLYDRLDALDRTRQLEIAAIGAQGDGDAIKRTLKELTEQWR
jgi:hypothetical protein